MVKYCCSYFTLGLHSLFPFYLSFSCPVLFQCLKFSDSAGIQRAQSTWSSPSVRMQIKVQITHLLLLLLLFLPPCEEILSQIMRLFSSDTLLCNISPTIVSDCLSTATPHFSRAHHAFFRNFPDLPFTTCPPDALGRSHRAWTPDSHIHLFTFPNHSHLPPIICHTVFITSSLVLFPLYQFVLWCTCFPDICTWISALDFLLDMLLVFWPAACIWPACPACLDRPLLMSDCKPVLPQYLHPQSYFPRTHISDRWHSANRIVPQTPVVSWGLYHKASSHKSLSAFT